jgi:F-type H+-transporting ATPase subunit epsilon
MPVSMHVELVSADRLVWSGEAAMVVARTTEGEIGVLTGHSPVLGVLVGSEVRITTAEGERIAATVDGGFFSVENDRVTIVSEVVSVGASAASGAAAG